MRRSRDLVTVAVLAVLAVVVVSTTHAPIARVAPGSFLALFAPGYALSAAFAPGRSLDPLERLLLSLGLSICACIIGAIALDATPAHLTAGSWSVVLTAITLTACAIGIGGRLRRPSSGTEATGPAPDLRLAARRCLRPGAIGLACAAVGLTSTAVVIARLPAANVQGYTTLWTLPVGPGHGGFSVGVTSQELRTTSYVLTAKSGRRVVLRRRVTLGPGQSWQARGTVGTPSAGSATMLVVSLRKADRPGLLYRQVYLSFGA